MLGLVKLLLALLFSTGFIDASFKVGVGTLPASPLSTPPLPPPLLLLLAAICSIICIIHCCAHTPGGRVQLCKPCSSCGILGDPHHRRRSARRHHRCSVDGQHRSVIRRSARTAKGKRMAPGLGPRALVDAKRSSRARGSEASSVLRTNEVRGDRQTTHPRCHVYVRGVRGCEE